MNIAITGQSLRSQLESKRDNKSTYQEWNAYNRLRIEKTIISDMLNMSYTIYQNQELKEDVILMGETFTMYYDQMYTASYLYSWMIIENFLERQWLSHVDSKYKADTTENILMKKFVRSTSDNLIKIFTELKQVDTKGCQVLHKLREIRNEIVHKKHIATKNECLEGISVIGIIFMNRIAGRNPFEKLELKYIQK